MTDQSTTEQGEDVIGHQSVEQSALPYEVFIAEYGASEGYPDDAWISEFCKLAPMHFTPHQAADFLVNQLPEIAETISCMCVRVGDDTDEDREPVKWIEYVTGGWSGAEDLIDAMLGQFWIKHFHVSWERGGLYCFEVPLHFLAPAVGERT